MSETFYIKKTAFDDNNFDLTQRELDSFIIGPGELNGPAGLARDSDLELYGFGSLKWGEGVDQNQYRLMESSACPAKVDGDFLVGTDDADGFVPGTGSFVTGSPAIIVPKDERDLGIGNGITAPLIGQIWYNTTDNILYNNELSGWETVFKEVTDSLNQEVLDRIADVDAEEAARIQADLDIRDDVLFTATDLQNQIDQEVLDRTNADNTLTTNLNTEISDRTSGDNTLTTNLNTEISDRTSGDNTLTTNLNTEISNRTSGDSAITSALNAHKIDFGLHLTSTQNTLLDGTSSSLTGAQLNTLIGMTTVEGKTRVQDQLNDKVKLSGGSMDSGASINFSSGGEIRGLPLTPGTSTDAASKYYVDTRVQEARSVVYATAGTRNWTVPAGVNVVYVSGAGAGQGGQGGGDGPISTPTIPSRPSDSYVSGSLGIVRLRGGYSIFGVLQDGIHATHGGRNVQNLAAMEPGQQPANCTGGDNCQGGRGGHSAFGNGGAGTGGAGGSGTKGGGGAGGFAQDFNEGQNFGWGGASGGFVFSAALPVTPGTNLSVRTSSGTNGSSGASGRNGGGGGTAYIIINW